jgi:hypothetical protein
MSDKATDLSFPSLDGVWTEIPKGETRPLMVPPSDKMTVVLVKHEADGVRVLVFDRVLVDHIDR